MTEHKGEYVINGNPVRITDKQQDREQWEKLSHKERIETMIIFINELLEHPETTGYIIAGENGLKFALVLFQECLDKPKQSSEEMTLESGKDYLERKAKGEPLEHTHKTGKR
jgi:hypothetical protein